MKQIKTIRKYLDNAEEFDKEVNDALAAGWKLVKREVLHPCETTHYEYLRSLYAELERDATPVQDRHCENCKYFTSPASQAPCRHCEAANDNPNKWAPAT